MYHTQAINVRTSLTETILPASLRVMFSTGGTLQEIELKSRVKRWRPIGYVGYCLRYNHTCAKSSHKRHGRFEAADLSVLRNLLSHCLGNNRTDRFSNPNTEVLPFLLWSSINVRSSDQLVGLAYPVFRQATCLRRDDLA